MGTTPYVCSHCDKSFVRSDVRAKHIQTMHGIGGSSSSTASASAGGSRNTNSSGCLKRERERDSSTASGSTPPMYVRSYTARLDLTGCRKHFMHDHHGPSPTFSQGPHQHLSSPQKYLHRDRSESLTLPTWVDTTPSHHQQHHQQQQILPSIHHHDVTNLSGSGSATLYSGGTPLMGGAGSMMLPPPTPFSGTSGTGGGAANGFMDPTALSSSTLPLDSGESLNHSHTPTLVNHRIFRRGVDQFRSPGQLDRHIRPVQPKLGCIRSSFRMGFRKRPRPRYRSAEFNV